MSGREISGLHYLGGVSSLPSTVRVMPRGFSSRSSLGMLGCGAPWKQTGRHQRSAAVGPTAVDWGWLQAGKGPPWTMEVQTSTPVGTPL